VTSLTRQELLSEDNVFGTGGIPCPYRYLECVGLTAVSGRPGRNARSENILGTMTMCETVIATLLVIGGVKLNPGPV